VAFRSPGLCVDYLPLLQSNSTCSVNDLPNLPLTIAKTTHDLRCRHRKIGREMRCCPDSGSLSSQSSRSTYRAIYRSQRVLAANPSQGPVHLTGADAQNQSRVEFPPAIDGSGSVLSAACSFDLDACVELQSLYRFTSLLKRRSCHWRFPVAMHVHTARGCLHAPFRSIACCCMGEGNAQLLVKDCSTDALCRARDAVPMSEAERSATIASPRSPSDTSSYDPNRNREKNMNSRVLKTLDWVRTKSSLKCVHHYWH
jgi:hypothetical protein